MELTPNDTVLLFPSAVCSVYIFHTDTSLGSSDNHIRIAINLQWEYVHDENILPFYKIFLTRVELKIARCKTVPETDSLNARSPLKIANAGAD